MIEQGAPPAPYQVPAIPSVADLPVSTGIKSPPAASPAIYVLNGGAPSSRRDGDATVLNFDEAKTGSESSGPRIIHLDVPRGR